MRVGCYELLSGRPVMVVVFDMVIACTLPSRGRVGVGVPRCGREVLPVAVTAVVAYRVLPADTMKTALQVIKVTPKSIKLPLENRSFRLGVTETHLWH